MRSAPPGAADGRSGCSASNVSATRGPSFTGRHLRGPGVGAGDAPHEYLVSQGFHDTFAADSRINTKYPTVNHYQTTLSAKPIRLDYVMIKGSKRVLRYENVMKRVDSSRPSDHNLVVSDVVF